MVLSSLNGKEAIFTSIFRQYDRQGKQTAHLRPIINPSTLRETLCYFIFLCINFPSAAHLRHTQIH